MTATIYSGIIAYYISTHTLTWSVTCNDLNLINHILISTHTLTWSVTGGYFGYSALVFISTHTLTWSVT